MAFHGWMSPLVFLGTLLLLQGLFVSALNRRPGPRGEKIHVANLDRYKRNTNSECKDKYKTIPSHSACLQKSSEAKNSGVTPEDQEIIVGLHNKFRAVPNASNMMKLKWDDEIANIAQHWADSCNIKHDPGAARSIPGRLSVGQNLAMNAKNWTHAITLWNDEVKDFKFGEENNFHAVGHYTQVVWADTQLIGCGYADCPDTKYYVCNYGPGGNLGDYTTPYKQGTKCADCSGHCTTDNLCNCSSPCLNGGKLFRNNCTCSCKQDFYTQSEQCSLNCDNVKEDPSFCGEEFGDQDCSLILEYCPNKCHVCPYGGVNYKEQGLTDTGITGNGHRIRSNFILAVTIATFCLFKHFSLFWYGNF